MQPLLIVQNCSRERPGLILDILRAHNLAYTLVDLDEGDSFPSPKDYAALIVLGGPDSANDSSPKMFEELERIQQALEINLPYLGICLGMQTLVKAAGGNVVQSPTKEIGFLDPAKQQYSVRLTQEGTKDPLFAGLPSQLPVFQLHGESVELIPATTLLAEGLHCTNQVIRLNTNAYGIQSHFELTADMLDIWLREDADLQKLDAETVRDCFRAIERVYTETGKTLFENFLRIAKYIP